MHVYMPPATVEPSPAPLVFQQNDGGVGLSKCAPDSDDQAWVCGASGRVCLDKVNSECITVYVEGPPETPPELDRYKY
jgi:hypothetical protein